MEQNKEIDITDILCDRPLFFNIGHKQYEVYPASLGETLLRGQALKELGLNITEEQIEELKRFADDVNYEVAEEREMTFVKLNLAMVDEVGD